MDIIEKSEYKFLIKNVSKDGMKIISYNENRYYSEYLGMYNLSMYQNVYDLQIFWNWNWQNLLQEHF